ncbi:MAG: hypothetical protein ACYC7H_02830, partial [Chloroflexota bacterium]
YVEAARPDLPEVRYWQATIKGNALANAKLHKPIPREKAERELAAFLERVHQLKNLNSPPYRVRQALLFGSLLDPTRGSVNDVDLAVELVHKTATNPAQAVDLDRAYARASGRHTSTFLEELILARRDTFRYLRARSRVLSLHDLEAERPFLSQVDNQVVFEDLS